MADSFEGAVLLGREVAGHSVAQQVLVTRVGPECGGWPKGGGEYHFRMPRSSGSEAEGGWHQKCHTKSVTIRV